MSFYKNYSDIFKSKTYKWFNKTILSVQINIKHDFTIYQNL